ncbi:hypothetical protein M728_004055 (plasmid) [Ensifer sp. WSM1721]|uniref:hypothetical protein n=1 Tax=Ensifer sp. WSM1721 TaxID=1041159 RepID=UPI0018DCD2D0|nr:hypothetical protein [Ensifer sp. WSM1721]
MDTQQVVNSCDASVNAKSSGVRVRLFEEQDLEGVRRIMRQHHAATVFRNQAFSDWKLNEHFDLILSRPPRMVCPVAVWKGKPAGVAWAIATLTC